LLETRLDQLEMPLNATPVEASVSKLDPVEGVLLRVGQRLGARLVHSR
jgi:C4-type Zn-finger protein